MGQPAAKQGDQVVATDTHIIIRLLGSSPMPHPFKGIINGRLSRNVSIMKRPAAIVGSTAVNTPPHVPAGGSFLRPPSNRGEIVSGSRTVFINGKPAARVGDTAKTCNDPVDLPVGKVVVSGQSTVFIGG